VRNIPGELKGANLFFVEDVGYQKAAIQEMERSMLPVVPIKPTTDKRSRLRWLRRTSKTEPSYFREPVARNSSGRFSILGWNHTTIFATD